MGIFRNIFGNGRQDEWEKLVARAERDAVAERDPVRKAATARRLATRHMDELIGLCQGVLFDGAVSDVEAKNLLKWIECHRDSADTWPGNVLYERITRAMLDGRIDADEEKELMDILGRVAGGPPDHNAPHVSRAIPYDDPPPVVTFNECAFCMTGQFVYGARREVEAVIIERGGRIASAPSGKTDYLIVGTFGSEEWLHSTHGTKIVKAVELKAAGKPIRIITERHWTGCLHA
jgi:NAD-dependent DNA ligase